MRNYYSKPYYLIYSCHHKVIRSNTFELADVTKVIGFETTQRCAPMVETLSTGFCCQLSTNTQAHF